MPIDPKTAKWADSEIRKGDFAGAAEKLRFALASCPDDLKARQKLRAVGRKHRLENPISGLSKVRQQAKLAKMKAVLISKKDAKEYLDEAEKYLFEDPNSPEVLLGLSENLIELELFDVAQWTLEDLTKIRPDDVQAWKALGGLHLEHFKNSEEAKKCYLRVQQLDSKDHEITKLLRKIEAEQITSSGSTHARDAVKDQQETLRQEVEARVIRHADDARAQVKFLLEDLEQDPKNIKILEKIADRYRQGELYKESIEFLQKALELEPSNQSIAMRVDDVRMQRVTSQIQKIETKLNQNPQNAELKAKLKKARLLELKTGLETYKARVEALPNDQAFKFTYGNYLFKAKKYKEALSQFQKAIHDPKVTDQANEYLARCFMELDKPKMSLKPLDFCLEKAVSKSNRWKDLTYLKGQCLLQMEEKEQATALFEQIYEIDIDYKDVADLI